MNRPLTIAVLAMGLLAGSPADAFDAYNNFGSGDSYDTMTGHRVDGGSLAPFLPRISGSRFTALAGGQLAVIRISLHRLLPDPPAVNLVDIRFHEADVVGNLGPVIASFTRGGLPGFGGNEAPETIFNSDPLVRLVAGRDYWIVVAPGDSTTQAAWNWNSLPQVADRFASSSNFGADYSYSTQRVGAMRIEVLSDPGDFDVDGDVDGRDFLIWQRGHGIMSGATIGDGDANDDEAVNDADFAIWAAAFGEQGPAAVAVPEAATLKMLTVGSMAMACAGFERRRRATSPYDGRVRTPASWRLRR